MFKRAGDKINKRTGVMRSKAWRGHTLRMKREKGNRRIHNNMKRV